ncbi:MAG: hypothetical protein KKC25_02445 [Proteobacteria bacterium]|nr:hypothetical protein [Pseudomonadota bacterium]
MSSTERKRRRARCLQLLRQTGSLYLPQRVFNEVQTTLRMEEPWELALNGLEASSLWLSPGIYQEARQSLDDIYATDP